MRPLDHYRLAMYLQNRKQLESRLAEVNRKIELIQHQHCARQPLRTRILNWFFG